ncbi:MAG: hypothetical protein AAF456_00145 [Planctomycetota bacterium]
MNKFVHIGYPKNLSTSLQRSYFARHPEIEYLGIASGGILDYADDKVNAFFEHFCKYCLNANYAPHREGFVSHFADVFTRAEANGAKAVGASSEHLSFAFTADQIDVATKAQRLAEVFGDGTKIVVLIRNQGQLLRSVYREGIRDGYPGTFEDYVKFLYRFQDKNFVVDCEFDKALDAYANEFGAANIHVFVYENSVEQGQLKTENECPVLISGIQSALGLNDFPDVRPEHCHAKLESGVLAEKRKLNTKTRHDLGYELWNGNENHRLGVYFTSFLQCEMDEAETYRNVATKRELIKLAEAEESPDTFDESLSQEAQRYWASLMDRFMASNERLRNKAYANRINLPDSFFDLS